VHGDLLAAISNSIVGLFSDCYGRGPTKAKSYLCDNYVITVLEDLLTTVEETLVANGRPDLVREVRLSFQSAMSDRFEGVVEELTGRKVLAYQSQITFDPSVGFEFFVLDGPPER
jgi:uncharacterized protein YbcI